MSNTVFCSVHTVRILSIKYSSFPQPTLCTIHSRWHKGHRLLLFIQEAIQHRWKEWLHSPQTTVNRLHFFF